MFAWRWDCKVNRKLHLAYLKFMLLITFNVDAPTYRNFLALAYYGTSLYPTRIKLSHFVITTWPDWSIFRRQTSGCRGKQGEMKKRQNKRYLFTDLSAFRRLLSVSHRSRKKRRGKIYRKIWLWFNWYSWWQLIESHWKFVSNQWPWR